MFTQEISLVGDIDDNCILGQSFFIQHLEQASDVVVDSRAATQVIFNHLLIDFLAGSHFIHTFRRERQFRILAPPGGRVFRCGFPTPSHILQLLALECPPGRFRSELHHTFRFRKDNIIVQMLHPFRKIPGFVRCLEMTAHHERFVLIPVAYPVDGLVGNDIGRETFYLGALLALIVVHPVLGSLEDRIDIFPLVMEHIEVVEAGRLPFQMPFTDQGGLVTASLHLLGDIVDCRVQPVLQRIDTVTVAVCPGHNSGTARCGD